MAKYNELNGQTHVHSAYGIWNCDKYVDPFDATQLPDPLGVHAHDDGLLHIHPITNRGAGKNARMNLFFDAVKLTVNTKKISWIADTTGTKFNTLDVNKNKCNGKKAEIWMLYWETASGENVTKTPTKYLDDFGDIRLKGEAAYAFVFAPKGTVIPLPPSAKAIATPSDVAQPTASTESTVVGTPTTVAGSATTVAGTATTVAGTATTVATPTSAGASTTAATPTTAASAAPTTGATPTTAAATTIAPDTTAPAATPSTTVAG